MTKDYKNDAYDKEQEIIFSQSVKAGKRIYYLDVKRNRRNDLFVTITESKKLVSGTEDNPKVSYEKHKIFLYREDFDKFMDGMQEVIQFIRNENPVEIGQKNLSNSTPTDLSVEASEKDSNSLTFRMEEFEK
ncbi:MAG: PUR family DNA/RNA-binding protein [Prevotellaceae bacterium]|jgi:hypothetical protein|nr:PUR family DNA/RNA-binding protein [Prevotellaceae bacterium]